MKMTTVQQKKIESSKTMATVRKPRRKKVALLWQALPLFWVLSHGGLLALDFKGEVRVHSDGAAMHDARGR